MIFEASRYAPSSRYFADPEKKSFAYHAGVFREESLSVSKPLGGLGGIVRRL
jgi:hypothetical protein